MSPPIHGLVLVEKNKKKSVHTPKQTYKKKLPQWGLFKGVRMTYGHAANVWGFGQHIILVRTHTCLIHVRDMTTPVERKPQSKSGEKRAEKRNLKYGVEITGENTRSRISYTPDIWKLLNYLQYFAHGWFVMQVRRWAFLRIRRFCGELFSGEPFASELSSGELFYGELFNGVLSSGNPNMRPTDGDKQVLLSSHS